jgi:ferredoxin-nitrite reductase
MWLIDEWGLEKFRTEVEQQLGAALQPAAPKDEILWDKRDHIGIYAQKQPGLNYVGLHVPVGRLYAQDLFDLARLAEVYGSSELRLTVEQNIIIPNVPDSRLAALQQEPLLEQFSVNPGALERSLVSCTGSQFCNFALIETKNRAVELIRELEAELDCPRPVRIHWTGCPNSCGQPQVADIGLMGTKVRKDGKTVEGVDLYMGGKVGKDAHLGTCVQKSIPCEDLKPVLRNLLIEQFGAMPRSQALPVRLLRSHPATTPAVGNSATNGHRNGAVTTIAPAQTDAVAMITEADAPATVPAATVRFAQSHQDITCTEQDLILDIAETAGIPIASSCRSGSCGTCKHKLLAGQVQYTGEPEGLNDADRASGYILTCIAQPIGQIAIDA